MPEWQQYDPTDLYPTAVANSLATFGGVVDALADGLGALGTVVGVLSNFATGIPNINKAIIDLSQDPIDGLFQAMTQSGIYWLFHTSPSFSYTMTPEQWLSQVSASLHDRMDAKRPIWTTDSNYIGAVVVMGTSENLKDLFLQYENMMKLFQNALASLSQIQSWPEFGEAFEVVEGVGRDPNWDSKKVVDVLPGLGDIAEKMLGFANSLSGPVDAGSILNLFSGMLNDKADYLNAFVADIEGVLNAIAVILNFEGCYLLPIFGQGDAAWLSQQLQNSTGGPMDDEDANYTAGAIFLATDAATDPINALFSMFGIPVEVTP